MTIIKKNKITSAIAGIFLLGLFGCSSGHSIPDNLHEEINIDKTTDIYKKKWRTEEPPVKFVPTNDKLVIKAGRRIPDKYANQKVKIKYNQASKVKDLAALLRTYDLYLVIPDEALASKTIVLFEYQGSLKDYLIAIENAYGFSFNFTSGNIVIAESLTEFMLKIPQNEDVAKEIQSALTSFGAEEVSYSVHGSTVFYKASQKTHQIIVDYLDRLSLNTSLISMQVAIITVQINRDKKEGVDWSQFGLRLGAEKEEESTSTESEDSSSSPAPVEEILGNKMKDLVGSGSISGTGASLELGKGDFGLTTVIDFLSTYGKANATQSLIMKSLSGNKVTMSVGDQVPYIDELGANSDTETDSESSDVSVEYLDLGTKLDLKPWFDSESQLVTIDFNMEISSLTAWVQLNAGNQLGMVSQPQTRKQEFSDVVKMNAGESVIIGGISFDDYSDDRNSPSFAEDVNIAHQALSYKKNSTYIMIRPTVTIFGRR